LTSWVTISFSKNILHHGVSKYISLRTDHIDKCFKPVLVDRNYMKCLRFFFLENLNGKKSPGRPKCRCEDRSTVDVKQILCKAVNWIHLCQVRDTWQLV